MSKRTEKTWGHYDVLYEGDGYQVKELVIKPGQAISYQKHESREELWYIIRGQAIFILDDKVSFGEAGDVFKVPCGAKHKVINKSSQFDLVCVETWRGDYLSEDDIERVG